MENAIEVTGLSYSYKSKYQKTEVLKNINCTFQYGRMYSMIGKSGSGKSTFLSLLAGLDFADEGSIVVNGKNIKEKDCDLYRRDEVSVVYQAFHLFAQLTILENVMFPLRMKNISRKKAEVRARDLLSQVGIPEKLFSRFPGMVSGGEQQRAAIARAMAGGGKILLADEPTGNLDSNNENQIVNLLQKMAHVEKYLVIIATHNPQIAADSDFVLQMQDGRLNEVVGQ